MTFLITKATTLIEAILYRTEKLDKGEAVECPCCGHKSKRNTLSINDTNAICLMVLYGISKKEGYKFYHVKELEEKSHLMAINMNGGGDFSRMRHWGFIEEMPKGKDVKTSGYWRMTDHGRDFCENKMSVPKSVVIVNGTTACLKGDPITIPQCFNNASDYLSLMLEVTK